MIESMERAGSNRQKYSKMRWNNDVKSQKNITQTSIVRMVVRQKAKRTNMPGNQPASPPPNDIKGIRGSQGPRIKNTKRAKGVHRAKVDFF